MGVLGRSCDGDDTDLSESNTMIKLFVRPLMVPSSTSPTKTSRPVARAGVPLWNERLREYQIAKRIVYI